MVDADAIIAHGKVPPAAVNRCVPDGLLDVVAGGQANCCKPSWVRLRCLPPKTKILLNVVRIYKLPPAPGLDLPEGEPRNLHPLACHTFAAFLFVNAALQGESVAPALRPVPAEPALGVLPVVETIPAVWFPGTPAGGTSHAAFPANATGSPRYLGMFSTPAGTQCTSRFYCKETIYSNFRHIYGIGRTL
jgi:hypothetical protein